RHDDSDVAAESANGSEILADLGSAPIERGDYRPSAFQQQTHHLLADRTQTENDDAFRDMRASLNVSHVFLDDVMGPAFTADTQPRIKECKNQSRSSPKSESRHTKGQGQQDNILKNNAK